MSTAPEPDLDAEWRRDRLNTRINAVRDARPLRLRDPGELHPRVAEWTTALIAGIAANLVLVGGVGRGKTWQVWEALERAATAEWGGSWYFATSAQWHDAIAPPVDRDLIARMRRVDLLVLDDLGSSRVSDWERECLYGVVDERWQHARPVVITSNVQRLTETLGERLTSRLRDGAVTVVLDGPDRRVGR